MKKEELKKLDDGKWDKQLSDCKNQVCKKINATLEAVAKRNNN